MSITYVTDPGVQGLGVFVDDTKVTADGADVDRDVVRGRPRRLERRRARRRTAAPTPTTGSARQSRRLRRRAGRRDRPLALLGLRPRGRDRRGHRADAHEGRDGDASASAVARCARARMRGGRLRRPSVCARVAVEVGSPLPLRERRRARRCVEPLTAGRARRLARTSSRWRSCAALHRRGRRRDGGLRCEAWGGGSSSARMIGSQGPRM